MDHPADTDSLAEAPLAEGVPSPASRLPTLQCNALRKIFDRTDFSPEEVAALGFRRLKLADGIGEKGIKTIVAWLAEYGHELVPLTSGPRRNLPRHSGGWTLQSAMRLLRTHGYEILPPGERPIPSFGSNPGASVGANVGTTRRNRRSKSGDGS